MRHSTRSAAVPLSLAVLAVTSFGCGSSSSGPPAGSIGPAGGTFNAGGGIVVVVPAGALSQTTQLTAVATQTAAPAVSGYTALSHLYQFGPDGTAFATPATVTLPLPAGAPANSTILWSQAGNPGAYDNANGTVSGTGISAQVSHFSTAFVAQPGSLAISPATATLTAGIGTQAFAATLTNATGTITWTLSPATGSGTLSATTGASVTYTPPATVASTETVTLTASAAGLTASATITVNPITVSISPSAKTFTAGTGTQLFTATVTGATGTPTVTWTLSPATGSGTLSATTGASVTYTPPATVASVETVTLTASAAGATGSATITVNPEIGRAHV